MEKHEFKSPDFYADKGNQYADVENYARAEAMYRQALIIDDTDAQIHNKLAVALREQGKLLEALDEILLQLQ